MYGVWQTSTNVIYREDIYMQKFQIKDIYFGKIDGYNEFLEYGQDTCKGLFYEFPTST